MKYILLLMSVAFSFAAAFSQNNQRSTGFKQFNFTTELLEGHSYWTGVHQLFMQGRSYYYACVTCPSFEPESCLLIADSTLKLITLDKSFYHYESLMNSDEDEEDGKPAVDKSKLVMPTATAKTLIVGNRFVDELCWLIELGSITADGYKNERMLDGSCTYFFAHRGGYRTSQTRAEGKSENGNEASQLMNLLNKLKDAVAGNSTFDEENFKKRIHQVYRNIFAHVPTWYTEREFYDIFKDADKE